MINRRLIPIIVPHCAIAALAMSALAEVPPRIMELEKPVIADPVQGATTINGRALHYFDNFERYTRSNDPIFDRFQETMHAEHNGAGSWTAFEEEYIPTLFVEGQTDANGDPDPLPRWQGADLVINTDQLLGDVSGDLTVDTTDLGVLIGSFGNTNPGNPADINNDGVVNTADLGMMIAAFGDTLGPFCMYQVALVREVTPEGVVLDHGLIDQNPTLGDVVAVPVSDGVCGACDDYRFTIDGETQPVYGTWDLLDANVATAEVADYLASAITQNCAGWGNNPTLTFARTESDLIATNCCFFSLFSPIAFQTTATPSEDVVVNMDLYLTGHQSFLWLQSANNFLDIGWDVMLGGYVPALDPNLQPFANADGNLDRFVVRQSSVASQTQFGLFFGTVPDFATGATGKKVLLGEWMTLRMVQKWNSTFELWVRDSETALLVDPNPSSDADGITPNGFARLVPAGPYGPAIWNQASGVPAPNPFLVETSSLRQLHWLWGGDPFSFELPDYEPANWFMDNIRITGPF